MTPSAPWVGTSRSASSPKPPISDGMASSETGAPPGPERGRLERAKALEEGVVEGEHLVASGFAPPSVGELAGQRGVFSGPVMSLGEVLVEVEEGPVVGVEVAAAFEPSAFDVELVADVVGGRLPALVIDGTRADHLEVLRGAGAGCFLVGEGWQEAGPVDGLLDDTV